MRRLLARAGSLDGFALKDAAHTALVMPAAFALAQLAFDDPQMALFASFGSMALLVFVDFGGPQSARLRAYLALALAGVPLIALGTLCSRDPFAAGATMALVGFAVLFCGVLDERVAAAAPALVLPFVLAVMVPAPLSASGSRLAGWALAAAFGISATLLLWPSRPRDRLRAAAGAACRALAEAVARPGDDDARARAAAAVDALRARYASTPYRPSGIAGPTAEITHMVADLSWLTPLALAPPPARETPLEPAARALRDSVAELLRASGALIETRRGDATAVAARAAVTRERAAIGDAFERAATEAADAHDEATLALLLDEAFRLRLLGYTAWQLAGHALRACGFAAPPQDVPDDGLLAFAPLGEDPRGARAAVASAEQLAVAHVSMRSVWLRNSLRGAIALSAAVLIGQLADVQHGFWVVLGTLTVLRSHALDTGATVLRALAGTLVGIVAGGLLVLAVGTHEAALWAVLPPATLLAAYAPRAVSFAAGQAAFSLLVLVLFNLLEPSGWQVGLLRIEDVAIGCGVSLAVGVLLWPRGAGAVLRAHLADAYARAADDVVTTVGALLGERSPAEQERATTQAIAAGRLLDDVFRQYLSERTSARTQAAQLALLVAGSTRVRRTAAMLRLGTARRLADAGGTRARGIGPERRAALDAELEELRTWLLAFGAALERASAPPAAQAPDAGRHARMLGWLDEALADERPDALAPALALVWTGRHLDALRRAEAQLSAAAQAALPSAHAASR